MTKFILIRHGEPRYDQVLRKESYSLGYDFGKLTINGIEQAKKVATDPRLTDADIIVSSTFTSCLTILEIPNNFNNTFTSSSFFASSNAIDKCSLSTFLKFIFSFKAGGYKILSDHFFDTVTIKSPTSEKTK